MATISGKVLAIIPAFNEEQKISATIQGLKQIDSVTKIIVIDDGSTDSTRKIAIESGAEVIGLEKNVGKGTALRQSLIKLKGDSLLLVDADIGFSAKNAYPLINALEEEGADMVVGILPPSKKSGGMGLARKFAAWSIMKKTGLVMNAPLSGQRAIRTSALRENYLKNGFGLEVGLTIGFINDNKKVIEVPINFEHTGTGKDIIGFIHRGRQFIDILRAVWLRG